MSPRTKSLQFRFQTYTAAFCHVIKLTDGILLLQRREEMETDPPMLTFTAGDGRVVTLGPVVWKLQVSGQKYHLMTGKYLMIPMNPPVFEVNKLKWCRRSSMNATEVPTSQLDRISQSKLREFWKIQFSKHVN